MKKSYAFKLLALFKFLFIAFGVIASGAGAEKPLERVYPFKGCGPILTLAGADGEPPIFLSQNRIYPGKNSEYDFSRLPLVRDAAVFNLWESGELWQPEIGWLKLKLPNPQ